MPSGAGSGGGMRARRLDTSTLMAAYARGIFPMAESRDSADIFWVDPHTRGILPFGGFHASRSLRRRMRSAPFRVTFDRSFDAVVAACAERPETWINDEIAGIYRDLHAAGAAHSIELSDGTGLVGGVYGVALGAAFFGESMFSRRTDASKIALAYLMDRLARDGFTLFDTQFLTPHLESLGGIEVPRAEYQRQLTRALHKRARFRAEAEIPLPDQVLQRITQTS